MIKYTIYTEDKNRKDIEIILNNNLLIKGYTIIKTTGNWQRIKEQAIKIEIYLTKNYHYQIRSICKEIKRQNKQEIVLFTAKEVESYFVY